MSCSKKGVKAYGQLRNDAFFFLEQSHISNVAQGRKSAFTLWIHIAEVKCKYPQHLAFFQSFGLVNLLHVNLAAAIYTNTSPILENAQHVRFAFCSRINLGLNCFFTQSNRTRI